MKRSRNTPILFVGLLALISYVSASRLPVHGQATASQDVGNIHVMFAEGDTLSSDSPPRFDTQGAARQFYQNHGDDYDILVYFTNFQTADDADGFFYETLRNSTTGIGVELMDPSDALANYGSASRLQGSVFQGRLSIYPDDDLDAPLMDGSSPGQTVTSNTLLGQEVMHRFNAFVRFDSDPGPGITPSRDMLGREQAHWSFYLESQASVFDGLQWRADSSTNFTAIDSFRRFSQLDLYLMGAKTASEVEPWFLIDDPVPVFSDTAQSVTTSGEYPVVVVLRNFGPEGSLIDDVLVSNPGTSREQQFSVVSSGQDVTDSSLGQIEIGVKGTGQPPTDIDFKAGDPFLVKYDATGPVRHKIGNSDSEGNVQFLTGATIIVNGTKKDITIDDVIAVEGPRVPDAQNGASVRAAFILLQLPGTSINQTEVTKLDNIRKGFTTWFNDQTGSRLTIDTSLAQTGVTSFTLPDSGGFSATTSATASDVSSGYARILPGSGSSAPAGLAIFGFTAGGVLVSEAGVPASPLIQSGRIYAEVAGAVNTGLAIANPSSLVATVTFRFTDATGTDFGSGTTTIAAGGQIAKFLNQDPFNSGDNVNGTFTFSSDVPISVIALRGFTNERAEFLITTLPVATLSTTSTATGLFPHFADGGGWTTQVILVNPTDGVLAGNVQFFSQGDDTTSGAPATVTVDGVAATSFAYSIPARSSRRFPTSGTPTSTTSGSVRIVPAAGSTTPSGLGVFTFKPAGFTVAEAGVPLLQPATAVRMYAESASPIQTGVAVANPSSDPATVIFELTTLAGVSTGLTGTATIPGDGQIAKFLDQIAGFENLTTPFQGVLRISTSSTSGLSIVGLRSRINQRGDFLITTTSPVDENAATSTAEQLFPHFADGGGWSTQFILFGGSGASTAGELRFLSQTGLLIDVTSP